MLGKTDQARVKKLLTDAVTLLCRSSLSFGEQVWCHSSTIITQICSILTLLTLFAAMLQVSVEGLLGITLDKTDIFLVSINETIKQTMKGVKTKEAKPDPQCHTPMKRRKSKKKHRRSSSSEETEDSDEDYVLPPGVTVGPDGQLHPPFQDPNFHGEFPEGGEFPDVEIKEEKVSEEEEEECFMVEGEEQHDLAYMAGQPPQHFSQVTP